MRKLVGMWTFPNVLGSPLLNLVPSVSSLSNADPTSNPSFAQSIRILVSAAGDLATIGGALVGLLATFAVVEVDLVVALGLAVATADLATFGGALVGLVALVA